MWFSRLFRRRPVEIAHFETVGELRKLLNGLPSDMMIVQWEGGGARMRLGGHVRESMASQSRGTPSVLSSKAQAEFMKSQDDQPPVAVLVIGGRC